MRMQGLRRWFLPETPDVVGMLRRQTEITLEGMEALVAWANGDVAAVDRLRELEHRADDCKRELWSALTVAFTTPLEPEDLFELSRGLDRVQGGLGRPCAGGAAEAGIGLARDAHRPAACRP